MPISELDAWQVLRAKVVHEDAWTQQRVNWLLAVDGLLLVGMAALAPYSLAPIGRIQTIALPLFGLVASGLVLVGLFAANQSTDAAVGELETVVPTPAARKKLPSLRPSGSALDLGRASSWGLAVASILMWVVLFVLFVSGYPGPLKG